MRTHVALLRGINLGRAKRVAMADLRNLVAGLGYGDVATLLNSGNVVFRVSGVKPGEVSGRIERALQSKLRISSRVMILTRRELSAVIDENPLLDVATEPSRLLIAVPSTAGDRRRLDPLLGQDWTPEALAVGSRVAYMWCPGGVLAGGLNAAVSRAMGDAVTVRNWSTILKIQAALGA